VRKSAEECVTGETRWQSNNSGGSTVQQVGDRVLGGEVFLDTVKVLQLGGRLTRHALKEV